MIICLAAFVVLLIGMIFWPVVRIFSKSSAHQLSSGFRAALTCIKKRTTFQKCEVRFEDKIKNHILKGVVLKHPKLTKPIAVLIYIVSFLIVAIAIVGLVVLFALVFSSDLAKSAILT